MSKEKPGTRVPADQVDKSTGLREAAWIRHADDVDRLVRTLGRMPRAGDEGVDSTMLRWIRRQQWARRQDLQHPPEDCRVRLGREREERLSAIPGWQWNPRIDAWFIHADKIDQFLTQHGSLPSASRVGADKDERDLAYWIANERKKPLNRFTPDQLQRFSWLLGSTKPEGGRRR